MPDSPSPQRVTVFLDWQNVYNHAREAFDGQHAEHMKGQVNPLDLALTLAERGPKGIERELTSVRIYRGTPDQRHDSKGYAACRRQTSAWTKDERVTLITRTLRYPNGYQHGLTSRSQVREKGIDVCLALDLVTMATDGSYDVAVVMSCDHDLAPAVERVVQRRKTRGDGPVVELAAWQSPDHSSPRMRLTKGSVFCHWLDQQTYWGLEDDRDYSSASPADMRPHR